MSLQTVLMFWIIFTSYHLDANSVAYIHQILGKCKWTQYDVLNSTPGPTPETGNGMPTSLFVHKFDSVRYIVSQVTLQKLLDLKCYQPHAHTQRHKPMVIKCHQIKHRTASHHTLYTILHHSADKRNQFSCVHFLLLDRQLVNFFTYIKESIRYN